MKIFDLPLIKDFYFKLYKPDLDKIKIIMPKPEIEYYANNSNYNCIDERFSIDVEIFKKKVSRSINRKFLNTFYKNIDGLTITCEDIKKEKKQLLEVKGCYYQCDNKVLLSKKIKSDTIYHELFHVASSITNKGNTYSGFNQYFFYKGKWYDIAEGINEGYTQLLTERYFPSKKTQLSSYPFEKEIALCIENIIGKRKLEQFYFTNDLESLSNELKLYTNSPNEIDELILKTDYITKYLYNKLDIEELIKVKKYIKYVSFLLIKLKVNQLIEEVDNEKISSKEFNKSLIHYITGLSKTIKVGINKFYYIDIKEVENYLNEVLKSKNIKIKKK